MQLRFLKVTPWFVLEDNSTSPRIIICTLDFHTICDVKTYHRQFMTCATHKKRNERFFSPHVEEQHNYGLEGICQVRFIKKTHNLQPESIQFLISLCLVEIYHPSSSLLIPLIFPCRLNTRLFNKQKPTTQKRHRVEWNALTIICTWDNTIPSSKFYFGFSANTAKHN